ncbi:MAG: hypothetical protein SFY80_08765 [Verrucomicrobiota bacterium]|nr:hypothetical protein [Verrucomicrobiota bacterium]
MNDTGFNLFRRAVRAIEVKCGAKTSIFTRIGAIALLVIVGGLSVQLVIFGLVRITGLPKQSRPGQAPFVSLAAADTTQRHNLLAEQALLYDSEPLFFPTSVNTASAGQGPTLPTSAQLFTNFPERLTINPTTLDPAASFVRTASVDSIALLHAKYIQPFANLQTAGHAPKRADAALISFSIHSLATNRISAGTLPWNAFPETEQSQFWAPAEFGLSTRFGSIVGDSLIVQSSGVETIDMAIQATLASPAFCAALDDGYHIITFGP